MIDPMRSVFGFGKMRLTFALILVFNPELAQVVELFPDEVDNI